MTWHCKVSVTPLSSLCLGRQIFMVSWAGGNVLSCLGFVQGIFAAVLSLVNKHSSQWLDYNSFYLPTGGSTRHWVLVLGRRLSSFRGCVSTILVRTLWKFYDSFLSDSLPIYINCIRITCLLVGPLSVPLLDIYFLLIPFDIEFVFLNISFTFSICIHFLHLIVILSLLRGHHFQTLNWSITRSFPWLIEVLNMPFPRIQTR